MGAQVESRESSGLTGCTPPAPPGFLASTCLVLLPLTPAIPSNPFWGLHTLGIPPHLMASSSSSDSLALLCCPDIPALVGLLALPASCQPAPYTTQPPRRLLTPPSLHSAPTPATCIHKTPNSTRSYIGAHSASGPTEPPGTSYLLVCSLTWCPGPSVLVPGTSRFEVLFAKSLPHSTENTEIRRAGTLFCLE